MDDMDAAGYSGDGLRTKSDEVGRGSDGSEVDGRIRARVNALEAERDQFALTAPIRAEERMNALRAQLQMEIDMRMGYYHQQIAELRELLPEVKETE